MKPPKCTVFPPSNRYKRKAVRSVRYDGASLVIEIQGERFAFARVVFNRPAGFRVLNERDLCEFWDKYDQRNGWLYEVHQGGWLELETQRPLFNSHVFFSGLREFIVVDEECISVLSVNPPQIEDLGGDPDQATRTNEGGAT